MPKVPNRISLQYLCNMSGKTLRMRLIFSLLINVKGFFKVCVARHFSIILGVCGQACLNYPKQHVCHFSAVSQEISEWLKIKASCKLILWFWWISSSIPKIPKIASLRCICNISKRRMQIKLIFCMQISIKGFYKLTQHYGHQGSLQSDTIIIDRHD